MTRLALMALLLLLTGCAAVVTAPTVQLEQLKPVAVDISGITIEVDLLVTNLNRFDLTLLGYSYTLQVAGLPLSSGEERQTVIFPAGQQTRITIPTLVRHRDLFKLLQLQHEPDRIPYRLITGIQVDSPLGEKTVPVDHQGLFALPEQYRPSGLLKYLKGTLSQP